MKIIKKYELKHRINLALPKRSIILSAKNDRDVPVIFVEVEKENMSNTEIRTIAVYGTDHDMAPGNHIYIGTIEIMRKDYHIYEYLN